MATGTRASPSWSPDGTRLAFTAATGDDTRPDLRTPPRTCSTRTTSKREPGWSRRAEGWPVRSAGRPTAPPCSSSAPGRARRAPAGLLRVPLDGGDTVDLAAPLDRNVMPGAPAYPGALPQLSRRRQPRACSASATAAAPISTRCRRGGWASRSRSWPGPDATCRGLSVAGTSAAVVLATPTSFGEVVVLDLADRRRDRAHRARRGARRGRARSPARSGEFTISDGTVVQAWLMRDPDATGPQPLLLDIHGGPHNAWNGGRRRDAPLPPRARRARAGRCCW